MSQLQPDLLEVISVIAEDFEQASEALIELERQDKQRAAAVSSRILQDKIGDVYYRAFAFEILYSTAIGDAVGYIASHAPTAEVYVLGAMIEAVTEDSGVVADQQTIRRAAELLKKALEARPDAEVVSISEKIDRFEQAYPYASRSYAA